ncbi:unnamed protein product [Moneuplotes crassus]|uniref:EamA domain-containing protein n=1 Tax=Euplotes crassus TaxID=5936 RepID=A0AAD1UKI2_EUPCR|nr:unnamed protein product [Moneuplotes crassus]
MNKDSEAHYTSVGSIQFSKSAEAIPCDSKGLKTPEKEESQSRSWILSGVIAGLLFGFGNLCVVRISHFGFYVRELTLFGGFNLALAIFIIRTIQQRRERSAYRIKDEDSGNYYFSQQESPFWDPDTEKFRWAAVLAILMDSVTKISGGLTAILSFKYALYAEINQGAITTVFSISSIFVAMISFFIFGEKLTKFHLIGMFLLIGCALLIVFSKTSGSNEKMEIYGEEVDKVSTVLPVFFALLTTLIYSLRTICIKLYVKKLKFHTIDYMTYSYLFTGALFMPFCLKHTIEMGIIPEVVILGIVCGVLNGLASIFLFHATSTGVAGPAYALRNIEPIIQAIFGSIFFGSYLNSFQIVAIGVGIMGSLVITMKNKK